MKFDITVVGLVSLFVGLGDAAATWPAAIDELEDVMFLQTGYNSRGLRSHVTPCAFSEFGPGRQTAAEWLRLAFHDMATANAYMEPRGGLDASIAFELDNGENVGTGFGTSLQMFSRFKNKHLSMADMIALGAYASVRACGGPVIAMRGGRTDATGPNSRGVPSVTDGGPVFGSRFTRMGFDQTSMIHMVACGHTIGGVHTANFPDIVPAGTAPNDYGLFDTTPQFDNQVVTRYLAGPPLSVDPLVMGPPRGKRVDEQVFMRDSNATVRTMADPAVFNTICSNILQRMIEVVPTAVVLSDVIQPYEVKPSSVQLTLLDGGSQIKFSGEIRIRTTSRSVTSVQILYQSRSGGTGGTITGVATGTANGFDDSFAFYSFDTNISASESISSFTVVVTGGGGSTTFDNNGAGFPVQDSVIFQAPQSCVSGGAMTIVAAVRASGAAPSLVVTQKTDRSDGLFLPDLTDTTTAMTQGNTVGPYTLYSATVQIGSATATTFDVTSGSSADSFKKASALGATCAPLSGGTSSTTTTTSSSSSTTSQSTTTTPITTTSSSSSRTTSSSSVSSSSSSTTSNTSSSSSVSTTSSSQTTTNASSSSSTPVTSSTTSNSQTSSSSSGTTSQSSSQTTSSSSQTTSAHSSTTTSLPTTSSSTSSQTTTISQSTTSSSVQSTTTTIYSSSSSQTTSTQPSTSRSTSSTTAHQGSSSSSTSTSTTTQHSTTTTSQSLSQTTTTSTTSAAATPSHLASVGQYKFQGCYTETQGVRALAGARHDDPQMTIEKCAASCSSFAYFSVEYGQECYCGNTLNSASTEAPIGDCNFICPGNPLQYCGAGNRMELYKRPTTTTPGVPQPTVIVPSSGSFNYHGCWTEPSSGVRALSAAFYPSDTLTIAQCVESCKGYKYAGAEYSHECFCANKFSEGSVQAPNSECSMTCAGDDKTYCGGSSRLTVYVNNGTAYDSDGCWTDSQVARTLAGAYHVAQDMSVDKCKSLCDGYAAFGVEYGTECFCGNTVATSSTKVALSECSFDCPGDATQKCGAGDRINLYRRASGGGFVAPSNKPTVGGYKYSSCRTEADNNVRALSSGRFVSEAGMTNEFCSERCSGFKYFGTEYGSECYCGDSFNEGSAVAPAGDCNFKCPGDASEFCGAGNRLTVYEKV